MRNFFTVSTLLILASFIANAQTTALDVISDNFSWSSTGNISQAGTGSNRETLRVSSLTGYSWGGHNEATSGGAIEATSSGISFSGTGTTSSNIQGSYVYTIFSNNGNSSPSHHIDLTGYGATFKLYFLDADPDQSFRLMVRDKNGQWFISQTDYTNGSWSTSQGIGTPKVVDEVYTDVHKAYPINTLHWNLIDSISAANLNALNSGDNVAITSGTSFVSVDLSKITGAGIYVQEPFNPNTANELVFERFELHEFEPLVIYNPAYSSHYIETSSGVKWGFSNLGGGGSGEFYYPAADSTQNLNASGWGRAFQSAWRSFYHGGGYNPTQGGRTRNHGASTPMSYSTSSTGIGTRIDYGPFGVPTMGRPDNDILTYWDLTNGKIPGSQDSTEGSDQDNVNETGLSERDEVITEYHMTGFYEDITNILTNTSAEAIRIYNQYDYYEDPGMIYQYQQEISTNFANGITDLVAYTTNEAELPNAVRPTRLGIFWGDRLWTDKFTQVWYRDSLDAVWLTDTNIPTVNPGDVWPTSHERLTILSGPGNDSTAYAVGMYFPEWSEFNQKCIAGVESNTGTIIYEEDRMVPGTLEFRWGQRGSGANIKEQGSGEIIKDFIKRDIGFQVTGMVEPRILDSVRVHERLRFELFHIVGSPKEIRNAVQVIDCYFADTASPIAVAQNITVALDSNGQAFVTPGDVDNGSTDNCGISLTLDRTLFDYNDLGDNWVVLTATDTSNHTDTAWSKVTVVDTVSPVITNCPGDITQNIDLDSCGAVVNWTAPTYYDNSDYYTVSASHASGDYFPVGTTTVTITVADSSGNSSVCEFDVTVVDNQAPYVIPFNSVAVTLGTDGMYTLAVNDVDSASYDNCSITAKYLSKSFFNCNDVPSATTWLVVEDIHGNKDSSLVTVQVALNTTPVLSVVETLADVLCYGDSTGNASITVNGGISPYVYNWSNGSTTSQAQNLSLGSYWYEVTDTNGCYTTDTVFIDEPNQLVGIDSIVACDSYTWIDGITYFSSNNTAITTISSQNGCDSILTMNLTVNTIDSTIARIGTTLYAQSGYDSYQWFECTSIGLVALNNQANDSITITANGDYTVVITNQGCSDTSACIAINDIGFNEYIDGKFSLFPNPTTGKIEIVKEGSSISSNSYQLKLIDGRGRLVIDRKVKFRDNFILIDLENYTSGIYHLMLINENEIFREHISLVH